MKALPFGAMIFPGATPKVPLEEALANIKDAITECLAAQRDIEKRLNVKIERGRVTV